jgi:hypothetical protein
MLFRQTFSIHVHWKIHLDISKELVSWILLLELVAGISKHDVVVTGLFAMAC